MTSFEQSLLLLSFVLSFSLSFVRADYQLHDADTSILVGATPACLDAFNANVSCPSALGYLYADHFPDLPSEELDALCTASCGSSLALHRSNIATACSSQVAWFNNADQSLWPSTYLDDLAIHLRDMTCMKRGCVYLDVQYCAVQHG